MIDDKTVVAIIPARGGSKGVPKKNLRAFKGKSLLAHTIASAKSSKGIDRIIVSSEDQEILQEARLNGADVPFVRPKELSQDLTSGMDPIIHALKNISYYDYVIVLQVTSPLRSVRDIDHALIECVLLKKPACVSVVEVTEHPYWMFKRLTNQSLTPFSTQKAPPRRQDLPTLYRINGAIYIAKTDWLLQHQTFLHEETISYVMPKERSLDIDDELDFAVLEAYSNYLSSHSEHETYAHV